MDPELKAKLEQWEKEIPGMKHVRMSMSGGNPNKELNELRRNIMDQLSATYESEPQKAVHALAMACGALIFSESQRRNSVAIVATDFCDLVVAYANKFSTTFQRT
jgi:hypothetical protein